MGIRFRRSVKILPGVRLNLSRSGVGISAGVRGLHVGLDAKGRKYASAGIPGAGLSSRQYLRRSTATAPADSRNATIGSFGVLVLVGIAIAAGGMLVLLFSK